MRAILTWHSIDESESVISTTASTFERQLDMLLESGATVVSLEELAERNYAENAVALTFDDGFANFAEIALPLLRARSLPAIVFVVTGMTGRTNAWDDGNALGIPSLRLMAWDELRSIESNLITIGGHSTSHRRLSGEDEETLAREVSGCATEIVRATGNVPGAFAYPYGEHDAASESAVARSFALGCTTRFALFTDTSRRHALPRLDMHYFRDSEMLRHWGGDRFRAYVALRGTIRRARAPFRNR